MMTIIRREETQHAAHLALAEQDLLLEVQQEGAVPIEFEVNPQEEEDVAAGGAFDYIDGDDEDEVDLLNGNDLEDILANLDLWCCIVMFD